MAAQADGTHSLTFQLNCSISGTCYFLDTKLRDMQILEISEHSGSNSLPECMQVILKPHWRYSLLTWLILLLNVLYFSGFNHIYRSK